MSKVRGYCGFYKDNYLRSSYEYVFCKILESINIEYTVEEIAYELSSGKYKPDFHLYKNSQLFEIIEIKSNNKKEIQKAKNKINELKDIIKIPIKLYTFEDLRKLCKENKLHIYTLIREWILNSEGNNVNIGNKNPMFGKHHSEKSKKLISEIGLKRCKDSLYIDKIYKGLKAFKKADGVSYRPPKVIERIKINCLNCNKEFEKKITSTQKYCCRSCGLILTTKKANNIHREKYNNLHKLMKEDIIIYFSNNIDLLQSKQKNKIYKGVKKIFQNHKIKDIRVLKFLFLKKYLSSFEELYNKILNETNNYLKCMPNLSYEKT